MFVYAHELSNMNLIECRLPDVDKQVNNKCETVNKMARQRLCGWDVRPLLAARVTAFFLLMFIHFLMLLSSVYLLKQQSSNSLPSLETQTSFIRSS